VVPKSVDKGGWGVGVGCATDDSVCGRAGSVGHELAGKKQKGTRKGRPLGSKLGCGVVEGSATLAPPCKRVWVLKKGGLVVGPRRQSSGTTMKREAKRRDRQPRQKAMGANYPDKSAKKAKLKPKADNTRVSDGMGESGRGKRES